MDENGARTSELLRDGVSWRTVYGQKLHRPFFGMRSASEPEGHIALCHAAAVILPSAALFSHRSAAMIHGMPLPSWAEPTEVEISVFEPTRPPRLRGIVSHQLTPHEHRWVMVDGLRVIAAQDTWAQLSTRLRLPDLVAIGDFLITGDEPYSQHPPPLVRADLEAAVRRHGRRRGVTTLRQALERIRYGSLSPQESRLRLALEDAGLPSPELNHVVRSPDGERVEAMIDLAYPTARVAIEYLGDHHRTDTTTYRNDIGRRERLVESGWDVIFVTAADSFDQVALRVRRALRRSSTR
ncbi:hypothetical protein [Leifsonia soli]|uniref:DUF559 domain-containing protein n=1 Tax=Leifsonia soli TaxID=582665 RepID=A0A852T4J1_9MICO|nr:hypothetical protein [Leifsonia soli]NYD75733.1 hypothetical protein [Leifsonia soli]